MAENNVQTPENQEPDLNEILKVRREKLSALQEQGNDPFVITKFDFTGYAENIKAESSEGEEKTYKVAGRIMSRRIMGKASFFHIQEPFHHKPSPNHLLSRNNQAEWYQYRFPDQEPLQRALE